MKAWQLGIPAVAALLACGCVDGGRPIDHQKIIATAKQRVYPALVFVKPIQETFEGGERRRMEVFGSGVIISADGYVVTNNHVAEKAIEVNCVLGDREQVTATVVGLDPETDLALLKLKLPDNHPALTVADFGDSDHVEAGQFVMALGSPFGFTRSISLGIISNTKRYIGFTTQYQYNLWLQTDAAINPGNSGGPLVDTHGRVIGINTLGSWRAEGIGFAIPANVVRDVVDRLKATAAATDSEQWPVKVQRAYTGVQLQALNDFNSNTFTDSLLGVLVQSVDTDSPGDRAGLRYGDILLAVSGQPIDGAYVEDLPALRVGLADLPTDKPAKFVIARRADRGGSSATRPAGGSRPATRSTSAAAAPTASALDATEAELAAGAEAAEALGVKTDQVGGRAVVELLVTPVDRGKFEGEDFDCRRWNMTVKEITKFSNPYLHFLHPAGGVYIQGVRHPGNASDAGLSYNDIILKIGASDVRTIADVKKAYEKLVDDKTLTEKKVLLTIKRGGYIEWKTLNWQRDYLKED
ncbi:MAG TPA: trypsin-like peptidase domain-containing protein [Phycisphaerae bacterium]|nr:trypsin-like peptidase domain-containing protein [Phycisphaerae bacterium]